MCQVHKILKKYTVTFQIIKKYIKNSLVLCTKYTKYILKIPCSLLYFYDKYFKNTIKKI